VKQVIIRINDVSDIDTSKITVYDLNNRYVDSMGNIFRLKIDQFTKKIEIIKILRSHPEEAHAIASQMIQRKIVSPKTPFEIDPAALSEYNGNIFDEPFNPDEMLEKSFTSMNLHAERLKGIMMNVKNSKLIDKISKQDSATVDNIFKNIEIDGIQQIAKVQNYQKELLRFPKHINYYRTTMDRKSKAILNHLELTPQKAMRYIMFYEMNTAIKLLYTTISSLLQNLIDIANKNSDLLKDALNPSQKRFFEDALVSISNTRTEIKDMESKLSQLQAFLHNPDF